MSYTLFIFRNSARSPPVPETPLAGIDELVCLFWKIFAKLFVSLNSVKLMVCWGSRKFCKVLCS